MYMVRFRRTLLKRILLNCTCKKATEKDKEKDKEYVSFDKTTLKVLSVK